VEEEKRVECRMAVGKPGAFDEDIPRKNVARELAGHDIHTTSQKSWSRRKEATTERRRWG